mmetsp:Transcript_48241/g.140613  ORF Transcript_48241/g.140613 Transcript_48241/m.140613 type:complete len:109 (+) Transcript_48241:931-1257(+)
MRAASACRLRHRTEQALEQCGGEECNYLVSHLLRLPGGGIAKLACHCFGASVVRALSAVPSAHDVVVSSLMRAEGSLRKDKYGAMLLAQLGLDSCPTAEASQIAFASV